MKTFYEIYDDGSLRATEENIFQVAYLVDDYVYEGIWGRNTVKVMLVSEDIFGTRVSEDVTEKVWDMIA